MENLHEQIGVGIHWVTVRSFSDPGSAHIAKLQLDDAEIPCYIDNEEAASTLWHMQPAIGGVRVRVPEQSLELARKVLSRGEPESEETEPAEHDTAALSDASTERCPKCQCMDTEPLSWFMRIMQTTVVLMLSMVPLAIHPLGALAVIGYAVYFLLSKPARRCLRCRHRFTADPILE